MIRSKMPASTYKRRPSLASRFIRLFSTSKKSKIAKGTAEDEVKSGETPLKDRKELSSTSLISNKLSSSFDKAGECSKRKAVSFTAISETNETTPQSNNAKGGSMQSASIVPGKLDTDPKTEPGVTESGGLKDNSMQRVMYREPVSQDDFVDAVTNVMMGNVPIGNGSNEDEMDDLSEVKTIESRSTLNSRKEKKDIFAIEAGPASIPQAVNTTLTPGKVFFYLDQKNTTLSGLNITPKNVALEEKAQNTTTILPEDDATSMKEEANVNALEQQVRKIVAESVRRIDDEGLFSKGREMHERGKKLLAEGNAVEALEAFEEAEQFQKESIIKLTNKMSSMMHTQGLNHCDNGDTYLAVVLLGVAEMLKHRPTAPHAQLASQVHLGYKKICPRQAEFRLPRKEMDKTMKEISRRAQPLARTMRAYDKADRLAEKQRRASLKRIKQAAQVNSSMQDNRSGVFFAA